jgi:hypothetical protein
MALLSSSFANLKGRVLYEGNGTQESTVGCRREEGGHCHDEREGGVHNLGIFRWHP